MSLFSFIPGDVTDFESRVSESPSTLTLSDLNFSTKVLSIQEKRMENGKISGILKRGRPTSLPTTLGLLGVRYIVVRVHTTVYKKYTEYASFLHMTQFQTQKETIFHLEESRRLLNIMW